MNSIPKTLLLLRNVFLIGRKPNTAFWIESKPIFWTLQASDRLCDCGCGEVKMLPSQGILEGGKLSLFPALSRGRFYINVWYYSTSLP